MKRKTIVVSFFSLLILVTSVFIVSAIQSVKKQGPEVSFTEEKKEVQTYQVAKQDYFIAYQTRGKVINKNEVKLVAEVNGKIIRTGNIQEGKKVRTGDLLYVIEDTDAQFQLKTLKSDFIKKIATLLLDVEIEYTERLQVWKTFFAAIDVNRAIPKLPEAKSVNEKTFLAAKGIYQDFYAIKKQEYKLTKYILRAPFTGYLHQVEAKKGSVVISGSALLQIDQSNELEIKVPIEESLANLISQNTEVKINKRIIGKVARIDRQLNPETFSESVYILPKINKGLNSGDYVDVKFTNVEIKNVSKIPLAALFDKSYVLTEKGKKVEVTIIYQSEEFVFIRTKEKLDKVQVISSNKQGFLTHL